MTPKVKPSLVNFGDKFIFVVGGAAVNANQLDLSWDLIRTDDHHSKQSHRKGKKSESAALIDDVAQVSVEIYNSYKDDWMWGPDLNIPRHSHSTLALGKMIYAFAGFNGYTAGHPLCDMINDF